MQHIWTAFGLTIFAGMATAIGSIIAFTAQRTNYRFLSISTGFSAGVMLYVSFIEIFPKGTESLVSFYGGDKGHWISVASFFGGILLIGLIDNLIPSSKNPHEVYSEDKTRPLHEKKEEHKNTREDKLKRMGLFTALAIAIHNFPEGLATFMAALQNPSTGVAIAIAIALHNIPEGISVSVPIYYATGNRKKAFLYSMLSGLAEPVGAAVAFSAMYFFTGDNTGFIPPQIMGISLAGVAGIMIYISLDELLPTSRAYGKGHDSILGFVAGMAVMALSLLIMQ